MRCEMWFKIKKMLLERRVIVAAGLKICLLSVNDILNDNLTGREI